MKKTKHNFVVAISVVVGIAALSLILYPTISNFINTSYAAASIKTYNSNVDTLSEYEIDNYLQEAKQYNDSLAGIGTAPKYEDILNFDNGIMGTISIPKINLNLPIYHGNAESELQKGAIHNLNSSLPLGGESTHAVISAHTALPGKVYFDNLSELEKGDNFSITILNKTITYEVTDINIVKPDEADDYLDIEKGKDLVTLVTCYPYAINSHRLLVTGERIDISTTEDLQKNDVNISDDFWLVIAVFSIVLLIALLIIFLKFLRKNSKCPSEGQKE